MLLVNASRAHPLCDRVPRRTVLQVGALGALGLTLPGLLRGRAALGAPFARAESCVVVFLNGGPSHLDMWDMKPDAPAEVRGEFRPIATPADGVQLSEHLPRLARLAREFALIRSAHHQVSNAHAAAVYLALTGEDRGDATVAIGAAQNDSPAIGSVVSRIFPPRRAMAPYVSLPYRTKEGAGGPPQPGVYGGWMGQQFDPFFILKDPNAPDFSIPEVTLTPEVPLRRVGQRRGLLHAVNAELDMVQRDGSLTALDTFQQRALALISSPNTRDAFDLNRETPVTRERYGRNIYGQSLLLSRRLVEAGCRMVTLSWAPDANATWDTHGSNFTRLKETLLPQLDAGLGSLLHDLKERGMLEKTLVVCLGEFGRTPKINKAAGRDHWPGCYGLLLAGGGVRGGAVLGRSDEIGAFPAENPVTPQDIIATIYTLLGISPETEFRDRLDRPLKILNGAGRFLHELV